MRNILICLIVLTAVADVYASREKMMIGGDLAGDGEFPFLVSIQRNGNHTCGGCIINRHWILTAAHCVHGYFDMPEIPSVIAPDQIQIMAGSNNLSSPGIYYDVEHIVVHPDHSLETNQNDIAMINIKGKIKYSEKIKKIRLQTHPAKVGDSFIMPGWGAVTFESDLVWPGIYSLNETYPHDLYFMKTKSIDNEECKKRTKKWDWELGIALEKDQICVYTEGEGACHGDSGGPLVHYDNGKVRTAGIVSFAEPCAKGYPDVYTRVSFYVKWIRRQTHRKF